MKKLATVVSLLALGLFGCSSKDLYNIGKENSEQRCKAHVGAEREQCLREINIKSYEQYEKERQRILNDKTEN